METNFLLLAEIIVCIGAILQSGIGFGLGPFAVPLLVMIEPRLVPGPLLFDALILTLLMSHREFHALDKTSLKWAAIGRLAGSILAAFTLSYLAEAQLKLFFGVLVLLAVVISFLKFRVTNSGRNLFIAGTLSGYMGTAVSIGGPPMALIFQYRTGPQIRATLSAIFSIGTVIALIALSIIGKFGWTELKMALLLLPGLLIGFYVSRFVTPLIDKGLMRPLLLLMSAAAALILIRPYLF